ncbi:MAG: ester cyclase, partial [Acidimicrobiales bacterium]
MTLSIEQKRRILERFSSEVWSKGDMDTANELIDDDLDDHNPFPGMPGKRAGFEQTVLMFREAMPDLAITPQNFIVDGELVMDHWEGNATQTAALATIPATGKAVRLSGIGIARIGDSDKIVERWAQFNLMEIMQQLDVVPGGTGWPEWGAIPEVAEGISTTPEENKA